MAPIRLESIINRDFLGRIATASKTGLTPGAGERSVSSGFDLGVSLRNGAGAYAVAVQRLNDAASFSNVTEDTLEKLKKLTDRAITLVERAASTGSSDLEREGLEKAFKKIGAEFRTVVREATFEGRDALSKDEFREVLVRAGLDEKQSETISDLFAKFMTNEFESMFASERTKGKRPFVIPDEAYAIPGATIPGGSTSGYTGTQVSAVNDGPSYTTYTLENVPASASPGSYNSVQISDNNSNEAVAGWRGNAISVVQGTATNYLRVDGNAAISFGQPVELKDVDDVEAYFVIATREDFFGYNTSNNNQLYLVDQYGTVQQQLTNFQGAQNVEFGEVDLSYGATKIAYSYKDTGTSYLSITEFTTVPNDDPATFTTTNVASRVASAGGLSEDYKSVSLNDQGTFLAYGTYLTPLYSGREYGGHLYDVLNAREDVFLATQHYGADLQFGFVGEDEIVTFVGDTGGTQDVYTYRYNAGSFGTAIAQVDGASKFAVAQRRNGTAEGYFGVYEESSNALRLYKDDGTILYESTLQGGSDVVNLSISDLQPGDQPTLNVYGSTLSLGGADLDYEMYAIEFSEQPQTVLDGRITNINDVVNREIPGMAVEGLELHDATSANSGIPTLYATSGVRLKGVDVASGLSIIASTVDYFGFNPSNYEQLYLIDKDGLFVHQISENNSATATFGEASFDSTTNNFIYTSTDGGTTEVWVAKPGTLGVNPNGTGTVLDSSTSSYSHLTTSNTFAAYIKDSDLHYWDVNAMSEDLTVPTTGDVLAIGFKDASNKELYVARDVQAVDGVIDTLSTYAYGFGSFANDFLFAGGQSEIAFLDAGTGTSYFAALDQVTMMAQVYRDVGGVPTAVASFDLDESADTVSRLSLAFDNDNGQVELGIFGTIADRATNDQLYRLQATVHSPFADGIDGYIARNFRTYTMNDYLNRVRIDSVSGTFAVGVLDPSAELVAYDETNGQSVISSTYDYMGFGNGNRQLFLVDTDGTVIHQYTNFTDNTAIKADVSSDMKRIFVAREVREGGFELSRIQVTNFGEDPATSVGTMSVYDYGLGDITSVKISNDGSHVGYLINGPVIPRLELRDWNTLASDDDIAAISNVTDFGFVGSDTVALVRTVSSTSEVLTHAYQSGPVDPVRWSGGLIAHFTTLEDDGVGVAHFAFQMLDGSNDIAVYKATGELVAKYDGSSGDSISRLSLAFDWSDSSNNVELGVFGKLTDISADNDNELYRLTVGTVTGPDTTSGGALPKIGNDGDKIFSRSIKTRPGALSVLNDLKGLRSQIEKNLSAIGEALSTLRDNYELARVATRAFIDLDGDTKAQSSPEAAASRIRDMIRQNSGTFRSELGNLQPMAVAALTIP